MLVKTLQHTFVNTLEKGLLYYTSHKARKVELTPFGKVKKKHKVGMARRQRLETLTGWSMMWIICMFDIPRRT